MKTLHVLGRTFTLTDDAAHMLEVAHVIYLDESEGVLPHYHINPEREDFVALESRTYRDGVAYLEGLALGLAKGFPGDPLRTAAHEVVKSWHNGGVFCNGRNSRLLSSLENALKGRKP